MNKALNIFLTNFAFDILSLNSLNTH